MKKTHYKTLEVSPDASQEDIKKSFRQLAKKFHPDHGGSEEQFKEVNEAYKVLSNNQSRADYDFSIDPSKTNSFAGFAGLDEMMKEMFKRGFAGKVSPQRKKGQVQEDRDIGFTVSISLEQIKNGFNSKFVFDRSVKCTKCDGMGGKEISKCKQCNGSGEIINSVSNFFFESRTCTECAGTGNIFKELCQSCYGSGITKKQESVNVIIKGETNES